MSAIIVGISGNLGRPSKTRTLVEAIVGQAAGRHGASGIVYDLRDLAPSLGNAARLEDLAPEARRAVDLVLAAHALVVASPVYKGSYTGLLKHLFDLIEPTALTGKPVLLAATGGGDRHALIIEHQLRPLFGFFEAATLATGVYAAERDFLDGSPSSAPLLERINRAIDQFAPYLDQSRFAQPDPNGRAGHGSGMAPARSAAI
jgi:FMN reductase